MATTSTKRLSEFLYLEYGGKPNDARPPYLFRIDDRRAEDVLLHFCVMQVGGADKYGRVLELTLFNVPYNADVELAAAELNGKWSDTARGRNLTVRVSARSTTKVRNLARAIRRVVGRKKTYLNCNWRWVAPRTADSLNRLADKLWQYRQRGPF